MPHDRPCEKMFFLLVQGGKELFPSEGLSKVVRFLKDLHKLAAFAHGFIETGANAMPISKVTDF
jgi:hypothetical protein